MTVPPRFAYLSLCLLAMVVMVASCAGNDTKPEIGPELPPVTTATFEITPTAIPDQTNPPPPVPTSTLTPAPTPTPSDTTTTSPPTSVSKDAWAWTQPTIIAEKLLKIEAAPDKRFYWPYYLYIPSMVVSSQGVYYLLVEPNNTGFASADQEIHDSAAKKMVTQNIGSSTLARQMNIPLLVPTFPRPPHDASRLYTHALDRNTILTKVDKLVRLDLQLIAMIDDAQEKLSQQGIKLEKKVLMYGFSSSGNFINRFSVMHPHLVQAAAIGAPGGWPVAPVGEWNGTKLTYPVGVLDMKQLVGDEFDIESFRSIPLYFFLGDQDINDMVDYQPNVCSFDKQDSDLVFAYFGDAPVKRWPKAEEIYASVGCSSQFVLYPGVGHAVTPQMVKDINTFFLKNWIPR